MISNPTVSLPLTLTSQSLMGKAGLFSPLVPSEVSFHDFAPSFHAILLPVIPAFYFPSYLLFLQWKVKILTLDTATSWKASSRELDHPLSSICNSVFSLSLTLLASLSEPKSLSYFLSVSLFDHFHLSISDSIKLFFPIILASWFQHVYLFNLISTPAQTIALRTQCEIYQ